MAIARFLDGDLVESFLNSSAPAQNSILGDVGAGVETLLCQEASSLPSTRRS